MEIVNIINKLKLNKRIFFLESDFQFALAWEIQKYYKEAEVILEYPAQDKYKHEYQYIDIVVKFENKLYPIELKYKTQSFDKDVEENDYIYHLKNQGAQDLGRYDYLKDIQRIEIFLKNNKNCERGYAILLTNDKLYWKKGTDETMDRQFRLTEGSVKEKTMSWCSKKNGENAAKEAIKGREESIIFENKYEINWKEYSNFEGMKNGEFKYCLNEINRL